MIFEKYKDENGYYVSATGDYKDRRKINFEIDHIIPLSKGGKTVPENLQLLARWENRQKGDMMPENYLLEQLNSKFYIQDSIEESKELAKKILAEDPDNIFTLNIMAAISGIEEKYTKTIVYANKVLKIDEKNGVALSWKGWAYIKKNNLKEAEKCLEEAVNYIDDFDTYYDLAACKNNMKKKDEELYYLLKALDITENHEDYNNGTELDDETYKDRIINISYRLGRVYFSKRKYTEAKSYFERCVECNEEDDDAINWIGVCYDRLKNREKALEYFELAHKLNKKEKRYIENIERIKE
nr:tetratricopeptide repeat protein [Clostridium sp. SM-530-WT-3G]